MSTNRIRLVVDLNIYEGKFAEFEAIAKQMVAESEQEPGTLGFHFLLSADGQRCRLVEGYADQAAITAHFIDGPAVHQHIQQLIQVALPTRMEIYGDPGPKVAAMASTFAVEIFTSWIGFDR
jgi:quinol monooxygenase YgiN